MHTMYLYIEGEFSEHKQKRKEICKDKIQVSYRSRKAKSRSFLAYLQKGTSQPNLGLKLPTSRTRNKFLLGKPPVTGNCSGNSRK